MIMGWPAMHAGARYFCVFAASKTLGMYIVGWLSVGALLSNSPTLSSLKETGEDKV